MPQAYADLRPGIPALVSLIAGPFTHVVLRSMYRTHIADHQMVPSHLCTPYELLGLCSTFM
jgi:hypothetical protein